MEVSDDALTDYGKKVIAYLPKFNMIDSTKLLRRQMNSWVHTYHHFYLTKGSLTRRYFQHVVSYIFPFFFPGHMELSEEVMRAMLEVEAVQIIPPHFYENNDKKERKLQKKNSADGKDSAKRVKKSQVFSF